MGAFHASDFKDILDMRPEDIDHLHAAEVIQHLTPGSICYEDERFMFGRSYVCDHNVGSAATSVVWCRSCVCTRMQDLRYAAPRCQSKS
jgi:hypothetical protein